VSLGCYFIENQALQWRLILATQAIPAIALLICSFWIIESPRWLYLNGRDQEAFSVLCQLHSNITDGETSDAIGESVVVKNQIEIDRATPTDWVSMWKSPRIRKRLLLGAAIMFANMSTGQVVLYSYRKYLSPPSLSENANMTEINLLNGLGVTGWKPLLVFAFYQTHAGIINLLGGWMSDKIGRWKVFFWGLVSGFE
jgi:hypothetical protein